MPRQADPCPTRRALIKAIGASSVLTGLAAGSYASRAFAQETEELRILFTGGSWQKWFQDTYATPWAERTKTKLVWKSGFAHEAVILAQRRNPEWDIWHANQVWASQLGEQGLLLEWDEGRIPNMKNIHPSFRYKYLVGKIHTPFGLAVNTKRIKRSVTSWLDLWDPAFTGKVGFPQWTWTGEETFHALNKIFGGTEKNIDPGIRRFKELVATNKAQIVANNEQAIPLFVSEDIWIMPMFGARTKQAVERGAPLEFIIPKEGGLSWIWNTAMIAGRPDKSRAVAERFANYTLEPELQIAFARLTNYPPTNIEAARNLPDDLAHLRYSDEQLNNFGVIQRAFDYSTMFQNRDPYAERWNKEVLSA